jgi:hypothetical protein
MRFLSNKPAGFPVPYRAAAFFLSLLCGIVPSFGAGGISRVGFCCTGFGVPGTGKPVITGTTALIASGEGFATVCDVGDPAAPKVTRYIESWYFTNQIYPLPAFGISYLSNSRGPLLVLDGMRNLSVKGGIRECAWDERWGSGRAFLSGIAPDGTGYTVLGDTVIVIDFRDPRRLRELARIPEPRLKPAGSGSAAHLLSFSRDFRVSAATLDSGAVIGLYQWKSRTSAVLKSEINNKDIISGPGAFTCGQVMAVGDTFLVVGHTVVRAMVGPCPELSFWNISDLSRPRMICEKVFLAAGTVIRGIELSGSRCFVIDGRAPSGQHSVLPGQRSRLYTLNLDSIERVPVAKSHPDTTTAGPKTISVFEDTVPGEYGSLTREGKLLYVNDYNFGLRIFDMRDPGKPTLCGSVPTAAEGRWLYLAGTYAYLATTFGGTTHVIDIKDPIHPKACGWIWDGHWLNYRSKIRGIGNAMYLPEQDRVAIVDISDPARPKAAGEACNWGMQHIVSPCLDVRGSILFAACGPHLNSPGQLLLFDCSVPLKPVLLCTFDLPEFKGYHICAAGKTVYCVPYEGKRVVAVDVSDPKLPRITANLTAPDVSINGINYAFAIRDNGGNGMPGIAFSRGHLFVVTGGQAPAEPYALIFDVREPSAIKPAGVIFAGDRSGWQHFSCDVVIDGTRMILGDYGSETAYDITDPSLPKPLAVYQRAYAWQAGTLRGNLLYVPKVDGLEILKLTF